MGKDNIQRLKLKVGFKKGFSKVDKCFELIDKIYYSDLTFFEVSDEKTGSTTWYFEDGSVLRLKSYEFVHLALFLLVLYNDPGESVFDMDDIFSGAYLEENNWKREN